jgi:hypothetical protein
VDIVSEENAAVCTAMNKIQASMDAEDLFIESPFMKIGSTVQQLEQDGTSQSIRMATAWTVFHAIVLYNPVLIPLI